MQPINLNGRWYFNPELSTDTLPNAEEFSTWPHIQVPGYWGLQGIRHDGTAYYARTFHMPDNDACSVWWLECTGVDYHCEVYINGAYVGAHTGYFGKFRFDATPYVALGENTLLLKVSSPATQSDMPAAQRVIKGVLMQPYLPWRRLFDDAQATANTGGVWGEVYLVPYDCEAGPSEWYRPMAEPRAHIDPASLAWSLDDAPIYPQGTVYIPAHYPGSLARVDFLADVRLMREANFNAIRVYGHILPEAFYEVCDEVGMLVWQDFPLYDGYVDSEDVQQTALAQAEEMVRQLGGYACIVAWNVHAEAPWGEPAQATEQNRALDEALAARIRALDPQRYVHLNSRMPVEFRIFARLKDFLRAFPGEPLPLAFGAPAYPALETLQQLAAGEVEALLANFGAAPEADETPADFIEASQDYQAHFLKYALEAYRADKTRIRGYFQHMFVDALPGVSTALVDHLRCPKAAYREVSQAAQSILPLAQLPVDWLSQVPVGEDLSIQLMMINDTPLRLSGWMLKVTLTGYVPSSDMPDGQTFMHHWNHTLRDVEVPPFENRALETVVIPGLPTTTPRYQLTLQLFDLSNEAQRVIINTYMLRLATDYDEGL